MKNRIACQGFAVAVLAMMAAVVFYFAFDWKFPNAQAQTGGTVQGGGLYNFGTNIGLTPGQALRFSIGPGIALRENGGAPARSLFQFYDAAGSLVAVRELDSPTTGYNSWEISYSDILSAEGEPGTGRVQILLIGKIQFARGIDSSKIITSLEGLDEATGKTFLTYPFQTVLTTKID